MRRSTLLPRGAVLTRYFTELLVTESSASAIIVIGFTGYYPPPPPPLLSVWLVSEASAEAQLHFQTPVPSCREFVRDRGWGGHLDVVLVDSYKKN
jgi:hypothetical protein